MAREALARNAPWLRLVHKAPFMQAKKYAKKELGQYPAILTSHFVNNAYIIFITMYKT